MAEIFLKRVGKHLIPTDPDSQTIVSKMPQGKVMRCKYTFMRNAAFHRKGFNMLHQMFDMQEHFEQFEPFRKWLVMKAGFFKVIEAPNGYQIFEPESLSWGSMDNERFEKVYNALIDTFLQEFGHDISREEFEQILEYSG